MEPFQNQYTFQQRYDESSRVMKRYPTRKPIIVEKCKESVSFFKTKKPKTRKGAWLAKRKYLIPNDLTIGQFIFILRKRIRLKPEQSIFLYINNTIPPTHAMISDLYAEYHNIDGFLYILFGTESVFG